MADNSDVRTSDPDRHENSDADIIELSEMTVGISPEDEAIIDLTEEIVGGAFKGCTGVCGDIDSDQRMVDLSIPVDDAEAPVVATTDTKSNDPVNSENGFSGSPITAEDDIVKELDDYFQPEDAPRVKVGKGPDRSGMEQVNDFSISVTPDQFEAALERVIRKAFGERIDYILRQVIERTVSDEIEILREKMPVRGTSRD